MDLIDKIAVVTGGARGIGLETAIALYAEGATVIAGDLSFDDLPVLERRKYETHVVYEGYLDVADGGSVRAFFTKIMDQFGRVDVLINNAGICSGAVPFEKISMERWQQVFDVNTFGAIRCAREVIPKMKEQNYGKIVNMSSLAGEEPWRSRGEAPYCVSKAANICLTMCMAADLGQYNINVNAVAPGFIDTDMNRGLSKPDVSMIPMRRIGGPKEVAEVILFLVREGSSYLTGATIDVGGGIHMK